MALLRALRQDLKQLSDGTQKTYQEWVQELKRLISTYLTDQKKRRKRVRIYLIG